MKDEKQAEQVSCISSFPLEPTHSEEEGFRKGASESDITTLQVGVSVTNV